MQGKQAPPSDNMDIRLLQARSQNYDKRHLNSSCFSVRPSEFDNNLVPTEQISMKFAIALCFEKPSTKVKFISDITKVTGTLNEDQHTFLNIIRSVISE